MRISCKIDDTLYIGHDIRNGQCVRCRETSSDASDFYFIRAWYSLLGEDAVTATDIAVRIERGHLPNVATKDGTAAVSAERFLKTLVNGAVVMNDGVTIVDVVALPDGAYRTVRRRDETDTLMRQAK